MMRPYLSDRAPVLAAASRWLASIACGLVLMPLSSVAVLAAEAGSITSASGDTRLVRGGSMATPLREGVIVYSGDRLVTGPESRIEVRFADKARIAIGPSTEFRVDEYYFGEVEQRSFFSLARGMIRQVSGAIGKRNHDDYRLTTPTGVLAIRGTEFIAREMVCPPAGCADPNDHAGLTVTVLSGRVAVSNAVGSVDVPAGSAVRLNDRTAPVFTAGPRAQAPFPRHTLQASSDNLASEDAFRLQPVALSRAGSAGAGPTGTGAAPLANGAVAAGGIESSSLRPTTPGAIAQPEPGAPPPVVPRIP